MSWDLDKFEAIRHRDLKYYRKLKRTIQINAPMVMVLLFFAMGFSLFSDDSTAIPVWQRFIFFLTYILIFIQVIRWFAWSLRKD